MVGSVKFSFENFYDSIDNFSVLLYHDDCQVNICS